MRISQFFGEAPGTYHQFGLNGHNGLDIVNGAGPTKGTAFYAMLPGVWHLLNDYTTILGFRRYYGYGAAWRLHFNLGLGMVEEWTFAHLQNRHTHDNNKNLPEGVLMAELDNTGFSTGSHLHIGLRRLKNGQVQDYGNGFKGSIDPLPRLKELGFHFMNG